MTTEIWISATQLKNFFLEEPLLDWLDFNADNIDPQYNKFLSKKVYEVPYFVNQKQSASSQHILNQGIKFESYVVEKLSNHFDLNFHSVGATLPCYKLFNDTVELIKKGIPIIHGGVLIDDETKTYGIPDLLIRSDYLEKIIDYAKINSPSKCSTDRNDNDNSLTDLSGCKFSNNWHYVVCDIKYTCIELTANQEGIRKNEWIPAYKAQLFIYNQILSKIQNYKSSKAFLMGRSWQSTCKDIKKSGNYALSSIGIVDFEKIDKNYDKSVKEALNWRRLCASDIARSWNIFENPDKDIRLCPNAKNEHDQPWSKLKHELIDYTKEITSIYYCGVKHRNSAFSKNIYSWDNKNCTAEVLGFTEKRAKLINKILNINRGTELITPKINHRLWLDEKDNHIEFYIDFETYNGCMSEINKNCIADNTNLIYMIGVGYVDPIDGWIYTTFIAEDLSESAEEEMCKSFIKYVDTICGNNFERLRKNNRKTPLMIHWSSAEYNWWDKVSYKYDLYDNFDWADLCKIFTDEPIVVKGSKRFKLKSIAKSMHSHKMIKTTWKTNSDVCDGLEAMKVAKDIYNTFDPISHPKMKEIVDYNEVDVIVLREILDYIRNKYYGKEKKEVRKGKRSRVIYESDDEYETKRTCL